MKKFLLLSGLAAAFLLFNSIESYACSCSVNDKKASVKKQVKLSVKDADAVFSGEVLSIERDSQNSVVKVKIKVKTFWKGTLPDTVIVHTGMGNGDCGYPFEKGKEYLIYADDSANSNSLSTGYCSRTTILRNDTEDLTVLGKGKAVKTVNN